MSGAVPFEDPLLHPPTPPSNNSNNETAMSGQAQGWPDQNQDHTPKEVDDGPIPFQSAFPDADTAAIFSPPSLPAALQPESKQLMPEVAPVSSGGFVDPLRDASFGVKDDILAPTASAQQKRASLQMSTPSPSFQKTQTKAPSPSIGISTIERNQIPTELPTQLASPPPPQRPSSTGIVGDFQAFSSTLNQSMASTISDRNEAAPETQSSAAIGSTSSVALGSNATLGTKQHQQSDPLSQDLFGLSSDSGLDLRGSNDHADHADHATAFRQPWANRPPVSVSTGATGINFMDQEGMERQELKSPEQGQSHIFGNNSSRVGQTGTTHPGQRPMHRQSAIGEHLLSPGSLASGTKWRPDGYPTLNNPRFFHEIVMASFDRIVVCVCGALTDSLNELMVRHIPAEHRVIRDWNALTAVEHSSTSREEILRELTVNNAWRAMARYTRSQILSTPSERIVDLVNLWYARLLALTKLGQYEMAQAELDQLGDLRGSCYRYETYPPQFFADSNEAELIPGISTSEDEKKRGSIVPFELFVLKARLQGLLGYIEEAIDQLYDLIIYCKKNEAACQKSGDKIGARQWQDITGQLHLMVLNYLVELKDYPAATRHARDLAQRYKHDINFHSGLGRLYLQLGDLECAERVFKKVESLVQGQAADSPEFRHLQLQLTMNRALLAVTQGQWQDAKTAFEEVLTQEPENLAAANNLAACELYAGKLNDAIPRLEGLMFAYPKSAGTSGPLVFNLATLYELRTEGSMNQKQRMVIEVSKWAGDQFNVGMFKI
ncbi:Trafficking protein particle complex subunit 12 [Lunasporangiospora selenospora]|uniref:Trafficking protein particle complex subunit 12 n=1 Tax=Lunasporangiospora selenospora TaxID=979761 RepID=A0A9P6G4D8_9FUNG|nr:Trafficking protein particle complex subunit 12 [Lunasporangiospora selenospora]